MSGWGHKKYSSCQLYSTRTPTVTRQRDAWGGTSALQVTIQINIQLPEGCKRAFISTPNRRRIFLRRCSSVRNRRGLEPKVFPKYKITCDPLTFSLVPPWGSHLWLREECLMTKAIHGTSLTSAVFTGLFIIFVCILYFVSIAVEMLKAWCVWLKGIKGTPFLNSLWGSELMRRISCFFSYSHKETNACLRLDWMKFGQRLTGKHWKELERIPEDPFVLLLSSANLFCFLKAIILYVDVTGPQRQLLSNRCCSRYSHLHWN